MHRTEGTNHSSNLFTNGPPATCIEQNWLNAIQEELCYLIEQAGLTVQTAGTETRQQLYTAIAALFTAANGGVKTKKLDMGVWDMDATASINVAHGLTLSKIVGIAEPIVFADSGLAAYSVPNIETGGLSADLYVDFIDATNIGLVRVAGKAFDGVDFNDAAMNRGHIVVFYID